MRPEWLVLGLALLVWSIWRPPILAGPVLAYLLVWALLARRRLSISRPWTAAAAGAGVVAFAWALANDAERILEVEQLQDLRVVLGDRWRLDEHPALWPPVGFADRPNRFYISAPGAESVLFGFEGRRRPAIDLGHGLFRADWDPSNDGPITQDANLILDGDRHVRRIRSVRPTPHPRSLASSRPEHASACAVSRETDELILVRSSGTIDRHPTRDRPTDCVWSNASIVVAHESGLITLHDAAGRERTARALGAPLVRVATSSGSIAAAAAGDAPSVHLLGPDLTAVERIPLEFAPDWIALPSPDRILLSGRRTRSLYLAERREAGWKLLDPIFLGRPVVTMTVRGDAAWIAITDYRPEDDAGPNHHIEEQLVEVDLSRWRILRRVPTAPHGSPLAIDLSDARPLVAFAGTDEVARLDPNTGRFERIAEVDRPTGVTRLAGGRIVATSAARGLVTVLAGRRRTEHALVRAQELSSTARLIQEGERAFYQSTRAGPSCQTCHTHGDSDYSMHDIGHGSPRPTLSTRGVAGTAPYLRGASYPSLAALEAFTRYVLGGYPSPVPRRAEGLSAYVAALPRAPPETRASLETLRRGNDVFVESGCRFCHSFPAFTNLAQYPEGFLFPERRGQLELLDTPSLIGVASSPPYLHDGRARSLESVLTQHNRANRHGDVKDLSERDRRALLVFLRSL